MPRCLFIFFYLLTTLSNELVAIRLFADDTSLYIVADLPEEAAMILNADLQTIPQCANSWLMIFNASKTLSMIVFS